LLANNARHRERKQRLAAAIAAERQKLEGKCTVKSAIALVFA
jgi:hypothetical protein